MYMCKEPIIQSHHSLPRAEGRVGLVVVNSMYNIVEEIINARTGFSSS